MTTNGKLLQLNIKLLRLINLWPEDGVNDTKFGRFLKDMVPLINVIIGVLTAGTDFVIQVQGKYDDVMDVTENMTAIGALVGSVYIGVCFVQNRNTIIGLVKELQIFEQFNTQKEMIETEKRATLFTKIFLLYGMIGNLCYLAVPYTNMAACRERRLASVYSKNMPCELITRFRLPFKYEDNQVLYLVLVWQLFCCLNATFVMLAIMMLLVSILMHIITQLQQLQVMLKSNCFPVKECIRYHITIIKYSSSVTRAFSSMMVLHMTITSFEISILGFDVLMVDNATDSVKFAMHLLGWLVLLFLICFYGQKLIDESTCIGHTAYSIPWYEKSVSEQKDLMLMILRSQKPITLSAASVGVMSHEAFLAVLRTAYSYFTLFLNMKNDSN